MKVMAFQSEAADIIEQTKRYFRHREEIFGGELFFTRSGVLAAVQTSDDRTLEAFRESIQDCQKCPLARSRKRFVFGSGHSAARLVLVGEAPGRDEDLRGEPFVGAAGQLLEKILAAIGFRRDEVFIGNILKCRPPDNRDPLPEEIALCVPHLKKQIDIIRPRIILTLGRIAAQVLMETTESLTQLRGRVHDYLGISVLATYHPAALLRNAEWKRPVWEDVQRLRRLYDEIVGDKPKWNPPKK
ncbi:MAG: uracil-DNA glycosylase [bacterium]